MGLVPGKNFSFSDHEGVSATFVVSDSEGTDKTGKKLLFLKWNLGQILQRKKV